MCLLVQEEHIQVKAMKVEDDEQHDKAMYIGIRQGPADRPWPDQ